MPALRLLALCLLVLSPGSASAELSPFSRFTLEITDILHQPVTIGLDRLQLTLPVVLVDRAGRVTKEPGFTNKLDNLEFILPEVDDEVLIAFFGWFQSLADGRWPAKAATIIGYDIEDRAIAIWSLENTWVSKIVLPAVDLNDPAPYRPSITLQADTLTTEILTPGTPRPKITDVSHDPAARTFTMGWSSVAGATYEVRGWDPDTREPIVHRANIVATGTTTTFTTTTGRAGLFYAVLVAEPGE